MAAGQLSGRTVTSIGVSGGPGHRARGRAIVLAALVGPWGSAGCAGDAPPPPVTAPTPAEHVAGEQLFGARCGACHGLRGGGSAQGPPLVHRVYEPSHHADAAFLRAVQVGVRAHHWRFGDMRPVPGLTLDDVDRIVGYVRWLQREAGIR